MFSAVNKTDERAKYMNFTQKSIYQTSYVFIVRKDDKSNYYETFKSAKNKKVAVVEGYSIHEKIKKDMPNFPMLTVPSVKDGLSKLQKKELDIFIVNTATAQYYINKLGFDTLKIATTIDYKLDLKIAIRNDWPIEVVSIIDKALGEITQKELNDIFNQWLNQKTIEKKENADISFSEEEHKWINNNVVKIGVEDWAPIIFSKKGNDVGGISGDILKLVLQKTKLQFEIIDNKWDILLSDFKDQKIDILPATYYTDERATYGLYSKYYFKMLDYIYVRENETRISDLKDLQNKKLAVIKDYGTIPKIRKKYPTIEIIETENLTDSINRLLKGEVDALYEGQMSFEYKMQEDLISGIKGIPQSDFEAGKLHYFTKIDEPILQSIVQKALDSIPQKEINDIKSKWITSHNMDKASENIKSLEENFWLAIAALSIFSILMIGGLIGARFFSDDIVAKYFGSKKFSFVITMIVTAMIVLISILVFYTLKLNKNEIINTTKDELNVVLNINIDRLHSWIDDRKRFLLQLGHDPKLITITKQLLKYENDPTKLKKSQALKDVRDYFKLNEKEFGKIGFFIISPNMISLGSSRDSNLGIKNFISVQKPKLMQKVFEGNSVFIPPIPSDVAIGDSLVKPLTMFFASPLRDENGNIVAVLTQRLLPEGKLSKIMHAGRIGKSGESYLIDQFGRILTQSRFSRDLMSLGLINEENSSNNLFSKDPGVNLINGEKPKKDKTEWALTKMAKDAIDMRLNDKDNILQIQYSDTKYDLKGYRDYRGVPVMGAWYWDHQLDLGMTTEIDVTEALKGYYLLRQNLLIISGLTILLTLISTFMLLLFGEKATRSIQKVNNELNKLLQSFDENVIASKSDLKGNITYASQAFVEISGYKIEELIGKSHRIVRHPDMPKELFKDLWKTIQSGNVWKGEIKNRKKYGGFYWVDQIIIPVIDDNGNISGFSAIRHDITAKKEVEELSESLERKVIERTEKLQVAQKQTESILSSVLLPMLITSKKTRKIVYANSFAENQYETTLDKILGLDIDALYTNPDQRQTIINELLEKGHVKNLETVFKTLKGNEFDALLSLVNIDYAGEECYLGVASDITEQKQREQLIQSLHKHTKDSIEYASLIQHALIPEKDLFDKYFKDHLTIWQPKDIVGGDIYLFEELRDENECLLMVIDCTGHGVPGAFVSMLVKAIERQVISIIMSNDDLEVSPAWILQYFNQTIKQLLKQDDDAMSNAGFDGGILYYNKKEKIIKFAGAETPLFYVEDGEVKTIKGNRHSIGYKQSNANFEFKEHIINVKDNMQFYLTTDGYLDQNGGEKSFPLGRSRFQEALAEVKDYSYANQKEALLDKLKEYQGNEERNDDITIVGFKVER